MPIQQPDKPVIHAGDAAGKAYSFPLQFATSAVDASCILSRQPALTVSQSMLTFTQKSADKPVFLLLTVAQQQANTPVTITTDLPDCIQLASDSRPTFANALTIIPSAIGTYVHVRYLAHKRGSRIGQLFIEAPYTTITVALKGRTAGLLPAIRTARSSDSQLLVRNPDRPGVESRWAMGLSVAALISGLAYAGLTYRCQLFPDLCRNMPAEQSVIQRDVPASIKPTPIDMSGKAVRYKRKMRLRKSEKAGSVVGASSRPVPHEPTTTSQSEAGSSTGQRNNTRSRVSQKLVAKPENDEQDRAQSRRRSVPFAPTAESDLERELNQRSNN